MDEYINRGTAIAKLTALEVTEPNATMADAKRVLADIPAADVAPVVHGRWIEREDPMLDTYYTCSACNEDFYIEQTGDPVKDLFTYTYCPNCGAKMDEKEAVYD